MEIEEARVLKKKMEYTIGRMIDELVAMTGGSVKWNIIPYL